MRRPLFALLAVVALTPVLSGAGEAGRRPKPLSEQAKKGLAYLVNQQASSGGWGQGGGWRQGLQGGRTDGDGGQERPDVGNTAIATMALMRAGNTPKQGEYRQNVERGLDFICKSVAAADEKSIFVTDIRDTQIQMKIGALADTFLASMVLAEAKGNMANADAEGRLGQCLDKVIRKIERNQQADGSFAGNSGWASTLSQGLSVKGLNRASQAGVQVSEQALDRAQKQSASAFDDSGRYKGGAAGDAGVGIYGASSNLAGVAESVATSERDEDAARRTLAKADAKPAEKEKAQRTIERLEEAREATASAGKALVAQLGDARYVSGFGSNGGEEFLSYMNISETLLAQGGKEWEQWDAKMTDNITKVQNGDGSWSGHHCITGRTFVSSTALLVLLADRAPVATSQLIRRH